ncbi:hypothetical protein D9M69_595190 [compost metagenome]
MLIVVVDGVILSTSKSAEATIISNVLMMTSPGTKLHVSNDFSFPKLEPPSPVFPEPELPELFLPHLCPLLLLEIPAFPEAVGFDTVFAFPPVTFESSQYTKSLFGVYKA